MTTRTLQRTAFLESVLDDCMGGIGPWGRVIDESDSGYVVLEVGDGDLNPTGEPFIDRTLIGDFTLTGFRWIANIDSIDRGLQNLLDVEWSREWCSLDAGQFQYPQTRHVVTTRAAIAHVTDGQQGEIAPLTHDFILQYGLFGEVRY